MVNEFERRVLIEDTTLTLPFGVLHTSERLIMALRELRLLGFEADEHFW